VALELMKVVAAVSDTTIDDAVLKAEDTTTVFVAGDTASAFPFKSAVLDAELEDEAVILNGNEYWKVDGSESRESLNP